MAEVQQEMIVPVGSIAERACERSTQSNPWFIGIQRWNNAERVAEGIISKFQPTIVAEWRRSAVINYLQRLLKGNLDCEVFAYGSVPLKTYLPDGDIDLSAVGANTNDLVKEIASLLENEVKNSSAEFVVKDVQLIGAEVKLVKCMVQNLVVDISVNQIGGLCTLCFLEQVDRVIGKEHIFKRSIILIKAWCYFESRTLGAHVGLISTYGLETLVLYIFHVFHIALDGPLSVLYKFLEYFSTFDWDKYAVSLTGPVRLSELPRILAERPPNSNDLLLKPGFLRHCSETLSVSARAGDVFPKKHLNILDPLNDYNNLGRSVSKGNFFRIRSAFGYGARKLEQILTGSGDNIADELRAFFSNTLTMHGSGQRPDLPDHTPRSSLDIGVSGAETSFSRRVNGKPGTSNDENSSMGNGFSENRASSEGNDDSTLDGKVDTRVSIPFYAPHLLFEYSKLVNQRKENQSNVHEEIVPCAVEDVPNDVTVVRNSVSPEPLDLAGDLMSHMLCLEHFRWRNSYALAPPAMMPPPPPPPVLLNMIVSEHDGINGAVRHPGFHRSNRMFMSRPPFVPNKPGPRGAMTYFPDTNRPRHGYQVSTPNAMNNGKPKPSNFVPLPENVARFSPVNRATPIQEPFSHRRRHQNPNRSRPADEIQRPRHVSGLRYNLSTI